MPRARGNPLSHPSEQLMSEGCSFHAAAEIEATLGLLVMRIGIVYNNLKIIALAVGLWGWIGGSVNSVSFAHYSRNLETLGPRP